jgi:hypothetical protein
VIFLQKHLNVKNKEEKNEKLKAPPEFEPANSG